MLRPATSQIQGIGVHRVVDESAGLDNGGEPDIALSLPRWLEELGLELRSARPIVDVVQPDQLSWTWLASFVEVGRRRLVDLGYLSPGRADLIWQAFIAFQATPGARMITPGSPGDCSSATKRP